MNLKKIIISFFLFFLVPLTAKAQTGATFSWNGNDLVQSGNDLTITLSVKDIKNEGISTLGGRIISEDESCLKLKSIEKKTSGITLGKNDNKNVFAYSNGDGITENFDIISAIFETSSNTCSTTIKLENLRIAFIDGTREEADDVTMNIGVVNYDELIINQSNLKLTVKENYQLQVYVPNVLVINPNLITWTSANNNIASVDNTGKVTGKSVGSTTINANYFGRNYTSKVSVINFLKGDLNKDGRISGADVTVGMRIYLGLIASNSEYVMIGDINNNNRIDSGDITYILRTYLGLNN